MDHRPPAEPDDPLLPDPVAARVLARAAELDATRKAGIAVSELRAAAIEAGISVGAFDAALAECRSAEPAELPDVRAQPGGRTRTWALAGAAAVLTLATLFATRQPAPAAAPTVEEAILLRCLSAREAARLVRPLLRDNGLVYSSVHEPRVLTIRATREQLRAVKSVLDAYEGATSPACASPPATTISR